MGGWDSNLSAGFISYPTEPTGVFAGQTYYNSTSGIAYVFNGTSWVMMSGTIGGLIYQGTWNAATNTPTLGNGGAGGAKGDYYVVSVAGSTSIDGITDWQVGDWIVNNGTVWEKVDNSEPPLSTTLSIGNTTGGNDIVYSAGDNSVYNNGAFTNTFGTGALTANRVITLPNNSGVVALVSDIITLYNANSTIGTSRVATITDTLTFSGGTTIMSYTSGSDVITSGVGFNPIGFGSFGDLNFMTNGGQFDAFSGLYKGGTSLPVWVSQLYDSATFVENACVFVGTADFGAGQQPYSALYYLAPDGVSYKGFEANKFGERLYSQIGGLTETAMNSTDRLLFVNGSGATGYMAAATWASVQARLGINITSNVIPRGTGTGIQDGTWQNVGNDIYPTTTGSNIGDATHRIGTIFMSSVINFATNLTLFDGTNNIWQASATGVIHNPSQIATVDFIMRSNTNANALFFDATGAGNLIINGSTAAGSGFTFYGNGGFGAVFQGNSISDSEYAIQIRNSTPTSIALFRNSGRIDLDPTGFGLVNIGNINSTFKLNVENNVRVQNTSGNAEIQINATTGQAFLQIDNQVATNDSYIHFSNSGTNEISIGWDASTGIYQYGTSAIGTSVWFQYDPSISQARYAVALGVGAAFTGVSTQFLVRGQGATSATTTALFEDSAGVDHFIIRDDGSVGIGAGQAATIQAGRLVDIRTTGGNYGTQIIGNNHNFAALIVQPYGTTDWGIYALLDTNNTFTGDGQAIRGVNISTTGQTHRGVYGEARNGSLYSIGVTGETIQSATVASSQYVAGVLGRNITNLDNVGYGGYFQSAYNDLTTVYTKDSVALYALAQAITGDNTSTGDIFGGWFEARRTVGSGATYAIYVPQTNNDGVIVLGRNSGVADTFLSVRSQGNDDTTWLTQMENSSGVRKFAVRNDGFSQFNTTLTQNSGFSGAYQVRNIIGAWTSNSSSNEIEAGLSQSLTQTPTSDSTVRGYAARFSTIKTGAFEVFQSFGVYGDVLNTGSANYDVNSVAGMYGVAGVLSNTSASGNTINQYFGLYSNPTSQAAITISEMGGLVIYFDNTTNTTVGNMYGIKVNDPVNTTGSSVVNSYILYSDPFTNATNNWGLYLLGANTTSHIAGGLAIGTTLISGGKLAVRGAGATSATRMITFENSGGIDKFIMQDDGQRGWHSGGSASVNASFGTWWQSTGYSTAYAFYAGTGTTNVMSIQHTGTVANAYCIRAAFQGAPTGTVTAIEGNAGQNGSTTAIGVKGIGLNGTNYSIGIDGSVAGGAATNSAIYIAAVRGIAQTNLADSMYGGHFSAQTGTAATVYTKDIIGLYGFAAAALADVTSTSDIIAAKFAVNSNVGTGDSIALLVPATGNIGTVVIGADNVSANASMLEVTGDIEIIGSTEGLILEDRSTGTRYRVYIDNGIISQEAA